MYPPRGLERHYDEAFDALAPFGFDPEPATLGLVEYVAREQVLAREQAQAAEEVAAEQAIEHYLENAYGDRYEHDPREEGL